MKVSQIDIQSSVACIEKHGYKLRSLPANWRDSFWQKLQDRCALTDPELICLQYEVIKRNGIFNGVYLGVGSAKTAFQLLKAKNVTEEELPLNIHDKKWQAIQKKCGIESIDWAAFRYTAAVVRLEDEMDLKRFQKEQEGKVVQEEEQEDVSVFGSEEVLEAAQTVYCGSSCPPTSLRRRKGGVCDGFAAI